MGLRDADVLEYCEGECSKATVALFGDDIVTVSSSPPLETRSRTLLEELDSDRTRNIGLEVVENCSIAVK